MPVEAQTVEYAYTGDSVSTAFPFPSRFLSNSDIIVGIDGVLQVGGYTVAGAGADAGGSVTFSTAPATVARVLLLRKPPASQLIDFVNGQTVLEGVLDNGLDKLTMICQYLLRLADKTVRLSDLDAGVLSNIPGLLDRAGKVIGFDVDGKLSMLSPSEAGALDPGVANSNIIKNPVSSLTVIRSLNHWKSEGLSLFDMDNRAGLRDGLLDCSDSMNALASVCTGEGFAGKIPAGKFSISEPITFDEQSSAVVEDPRGCIQGGGIAQTEIIARANGDYQAIRFIGSATPGGIGLGIRPSGFMLTGKGGNIGTGLHFNQYAFWSMDNVWISGFDQGIYALDVLSTHWSSIFIRGNKRGLVAAYENFSRPNAWTLTNVDFGLNSEFAAVIQEPSLFSIDGGAVQGCGIGGTGAFGFRGGILLANSGTEGAGGVNMRNVYYEYNSGDADVKIEATNQTAVHNFTGCNFMRLTNTDFVNNNVQVSVGGTAVNVVNFSGCGFEHSGSYVPSASRKYVSVAAINGKVNDLGGNFFLSDLEYPELLAYGSGLRDGSVSADLSVNDLPRGWSISKLGTGQYIITHGMGLPIEAYRVSASITGGSAGLVLNIYKSTTEFVVSTANSAGTLTDYPFDFAVTRR